MCVKTQVPKEPRHQFLYQSRLFQRTKERKEEEKHAVYSYATTRLANARTHESVIVLA